MTVFYDIYAELCEKKGISPSRAALEMGFNKGSVSYWKNKGGSPGREVMLKMVNFFKVSMDFLTGTEAQGERYRSALPEHAGALELEGAPLSHEAPPAPKMTEVCEYFLGETPRVPLKLSEKIKILRKRQGLTLDYVAKAVGVDRKTLSMWESDETKDIRRYKIGLLAKALDTTPDYLLGREELPPPRTQNLESYELGDLFETLKTRGECLALLMLARDSDREDVEMTISFLRSLKSAGKKAGISEQLAD